MKIEILKIITAILIAFLGQGQATLKDDDERISKLFMDAIDPKQIEKNLGELANRMHRAGTSEGLSVADYIKQKFVDYGLKPVETEDYDVLLSYPNSDQPDQVILLDTNNKEARVSNGKSPVLEKSESASKNADLQFLAFSKPGTAISKNLIFANFGRLEDFRYLQDQKLPLNGSILLMRYGYLWRGTKIRLAQQFGAAGVILYSDPQDYHGSEKQGKNNTFPHNDHLPPNDVQRGTIIAEDNGDVLTPLLPAKDYVTRKTVEQMQDAKILPGIPATVIGYGDALKLLQEMEGFKAPDNWQGTLPVTYTLGGKFKTASKIKLTVSGNLERRKIRNVIGYIKGSVEPDRYVLLGNHHDAWTYGGLDPSSGTATLLEIARAFGNLVAEKNWSPRRTLVFCAWDAEEYGLIGSTEWVEQHLARLQSQAVAYLNVDTAVTGHYSVFARGVPVLKDALFQAAKRVPNPNAAEAKSGVKDVFDSWTRATGLKEVDTLVGSGSDYKPFLHYAGIPVMDLRYGSVDRSYPLYHTLHDTIFLVKNMTDPTFVYHQAVARLWGEFARILADSPIIPFNLDDYANDLQDHFTMFERWLNQRPYAFAVELTPVRDGLDAFRQATHVFSTRSRALTNELVWSTDAEKRFPEIKVINDKLLHLERFFIQPHGTPHRPSVRHVLFGPGITDSYSGVLFPGIDAALEYAFEKSVPKKETANSDHDKIVNEQISWVAHCLHAASDWLTREF